jgi:hypothetical protein
LKEAFPVREALAQIHAEAGRVERSDVGVSVELGQCGL